MWHCEPSAAYDIPLFDISNTLYELLLEPWSEYLLSIGYVLSNVCVVFVFIAYGVIPCWHGLICWFFPCWWCMFCYKHLTFTALCLIGTIWSATYSVMGFVTRILFFGWFCYAVTCLYVTVFYLCCASPDLWSVVLCVIGTVWSMWCSFLGILCFFSSLELYDIA